MRVVHNGKKRRIHLSAAERRALADTVERVRCPSCNRLRLVVRASTVACTSCNWLAALGKDVSVGFVRVPHWTGNIAVRVHSIVTTPGRELYQAPEVWSKHTPYGLEVAI